MAKTGWKMASPESTGEIKSILTEGQIGVATVSELRWGVLLNPCTIASDLKYCKLVMHKNYSLKQSKCYFKIRIKLPRIIEMFKLGLF